MVKFPAYYKPEDVPKRYVPRFDLVAAAAAEYIRKNGKVRNKTDRAIVGIDFQGDFCLPEIRDETGNVIQPAGKLLVNGAIADVRLFIEYIYMYPEEIAALILTQDWHVKKQIFFGPWWKDTATGQAVADFTQITAAEVESGRFVPNFDPEWSVGYAKKLGSFTIWPLHCEADTEGAELVPALSEAVRWLELVSSAEIIVFRKGMHPLTEHYGPFEPCVPIPGESELDIEMLDLLRKHSETVFLGEAADYCVKEGIRQATEYFEKTGDLHKVLIWKNVMSFVFPDNRPALEAWFDKLKEKGVRVEDIPKP